MDATAVDLRTKKAIQIVRAQRIKRLRPDIFIVPSQNGNGTYVVDDTTGDCTCPDAAGAPIGGADGRTRMRLCKHALAIRITTKRLTLPDGTTFEQTSVTYEHKNSYSATRLALINESRNVPRLLADLCAPLHVPVVKRGRGRPRAPMSAIVFAAIMRQYTKECSRVAHGIVLDWKERGLIDVAPDFSTVSRYMLDETFTANLRFLLAQSAAPLIGLESHVAVDGSGWTACHFTRWRNEKEVEKREHNWVRGHVLVGVRTLAALEAEVTEADTGESPVFRDLIARVGERSDKIKVVLADAGYAGFENFLAVEEIGATPYIDFRCNKRDDTGPPIVRKMFHMFSAQHDEWKKEYGLRSNAEAYFSGCKKRWGALRTDDPRAQINEVFCRLIAYNLCRVNLMTYEMGIAPTFWPEGTAGGAEPAPEVKPKTVKAYVVPALSPALPEIPDLIVPGGAS